MERVVRTSGMAGAGRLWREVGGEGDAWMEGNGMDFDHFFPVFNVASVVYHKV